jgi:methyl coenzyme M reductase subunit D
MSKAEILDILPTLRPDERQEILDRLCDLQEADLTAVHQEWVNEAVDSGPARPAEAADWERALTRGLARASKGS